MGECFFDSLGDVCFVSLCELRFDSVGVLHSDEDGSYVKLKETTENTFIVEFVDYKISLPMILSKDGDFIINCDKNGTISGSRYKILDNNPVLLFKMKKKKTTQVISLKK